MIKKEKRIQEDRVIALLYLLKISCLIFKDYYGIGLSTRPGIMATVGSTIRSTMMISY